MVGGGYDSCDDANVESPACTGSKGGFIYVLNADTGALIRSFTTDRPVAAAIAMVDVDNDSYPYYAYAADTGGNLYRVDFIASPTTKVALTSAQWTRRKIAATGEGRKFLFAPALTPVTDLDALANYSTSDSCATAPVLPTSTLAGWFIKLNQNGQGEQVVTSALIAGCMVTFSTNRLVPQLEGSCSTTLGEARGYWVKLLNASGAIGVPGACGGRRSSVFVGGGLPPSPVFASGVDVSGTSASVVLGAAQKDADNGGGVSVPISPQRVRPAISSKRKRAYTYTKGD